GKLADELGHLRRVDPETYRRESSDVRKQDREIHADEALVFPERLEIVYFQRRELRLRYAQPQQPLFDRLAQILDLLIHGNAPRLDHHLPPAQLVVALGQDLRLLKERPGIMIISPEPPERALGAIEQDVRSTFLAGLSPQEQSAKDVENGALLVSVLPRRD